MLIGAVYRTFGNFDLALKTLWEGYDFLKACGHYPVFVAAAANSMANIDLDMGNLGEALSMFNVTYEESTRADDFYFMIYALHGLGRVYVLQNKPAEAVEMFQRALQLAEAHDNPLQISNSLTELATLDFRAGKLAEAERLSARALSIREQHRLLGGAVTNCIRLAEIHGKRSEWPEALAVLTRGLAIAEEVRVSRRSPRSTRCCRTCTSTCTTSRRASITTSGSTSCGSRWSGRTAHASSPMRGSSSRRSRRRKENVVIKAQKAEIQRKNVELQDTIDELTRAKIGRKAKALTLAVAVVLFIFQDAILRTVLRLMPSENYFLLLAVKMAIIFSLSPINQGIERHLLKKMAQKKKRGMAAAAATAMPVPIS